ncbi:MAG: fibronectin type III domain-containing protein, partial [Promethearchaeota archaeon]
MARKNTRWHAILTGAALPAFWIFLFTMLSIYRASLSQVLSFRSDPSYAAYVYSGLVGAVLLHVWAGAALYNMVRPFKFLERIPRTLRRVGDLALGVLCACLVVGAGVSSVLAVNASYAMRDLETNTEKEPYLTWTGDPTSTMTVTWETRSATSTKLELGSSKDNLAAVADVATPNTHHEVTVSGLQPGTTYFYRVSGFPSIYTFKTAGSPSSSKVVKFVVYGDNRYDDDHIGGWLASENHHQGIVRRILQEEALPDGSLDFNFTLNVGDVVLRGGDVFHWTKFHREIVPLATSRPYMIALGNHEYYGGDSQYSSSEAEHAHQYWTYAPNPTTRNEFDYWFAVGNCMFVVFDSAEHGTVQPEQAAWFNQTLAAHAGDYDWVFTVNHHPLYSHG